MISIIVPIYNVEKYLKRCIDSLINQTYRNIEIILVDDGSPDNCGKICDEYAKADSRIKVIHQINSGVSAARNAGLKIANGEYIGFIDSDDFVSPEMYEMLLTSMIKNNCDIAIGGYDYVDESGNVNRSYIKKNDEVLSQHDVLYKQFDIEPTIRFGVVNKLYKRELINDVKFPENLKSSEDGVFLYKYLKKISKAVFVHKPLYKNVERQGSATHGGLAPESLRDALYVHKKMADDVKILYKDVYHHAFSFYIDICLRYYNSCKNNKAVYDEICDILRKEKLNVLKCKDLSLKYKINFLIKY